MHSNSVYTDKLIKVYLKIRDKRAELKSDFDKEDSKLSEQQDLIKDEMMKHLDATKAKNVSTDTGTFYKTTKTVYQTNNWEEMRQFIIEEQVPEFLQQRLHQKAIKEWLEENPDKLPKGLHASTEYTINVRKKK